MIRNQNGGFNLGGKPSKGTRADRRLKRNRPIVRKIKLPVRKAGK